MGGGVMGAAKGAIAGARQGGIKGGLAGALKGAFGKGDEEGMKVFVTNFPPGLGGGDTITRMTGPRSTPKGGKNKGLGFFGRMKQGFQAGRQRGGIGRGLAGGFKAATKGGLGKMAGRGFAAAKGGLGGLFKGGFKSGIKKVPILGLLASLGFAGASAAQGDLTGALMEVASGGASMLPGAGTAASVAIDAANMARGMAQPVNDFSLPVPAAAAFGMRANASDQIVGAKEGGVLDKKLDKMIELLKKSSEGGNKEIVLKVNNKELARTVIGSINNDFYNMSI